MSILVNKRLINVDEYYKMAKIGVLKPDERVELIHGEIINMAPIGSRHAAIVRQLSKTLSDYISEEKIISNQQPLYLDQWNELQPDIAILIYRDDNYFDAHPTASDVALIIEVSDTTYSIDKNVKLPIYASAGIPEYWIINICVKRIEVYKEPFEEHFRIRTLYLPDDSVPVLDASLQVADILIK